MAWQSVPRAVKSVPAQARRPSGGPAPQAPFSKEKAASPRSCMAKMKERGLSTAARSASEEGLDGERARALGVILSPRRPSGR